MTHTAQMETNFPYENNNMTHTAQMETNFPYDYEDQDTDSEAVERNDPSVVSVALQESAVESERDEPKLSADL